MTELERLKAECLACRRCAIGGVSMDGNPCNVFSNMNAGAKIVVVGQNPGKNEVLQGEPFVGVSGEFFNQAIGDVLGVGRERFYICNTVRCFTPGNRRPYRLEVDNCRDFLDREMALVQPEVIVTLGGPALKQITGMGGVSKHHGELQVSLRYKCRVLPLLHPSPLNMNTLSKREDFYRDLAVLREFLG